MPPAFGIMATYIIGDVHGCFETLGRLLKLVRYDDTRDRVLMTGDLVNGGPESAAVLRWAKMHQAGVVLGNHDLHLLAVAAGARPPRKKDTFFDVFEADDGEALLGWLRFRPLVICENEFLLVHSGLLPQWDIATALGLAAEAERAIRAEGKEAAFFRTMYGDEPRQWCPRSAGMDRIRIIINAMTRMRMLGAEEEMDFDYTGPVDGAPSELRPWFACSPRAAEEKPLFFGHWAALGFCPGERVVALDSGCVWGGRLTAWRLEDRRAFQVESELA